MQGDFNQAKSRFNANNAAFELTAGLTYHFKSSTGNRYFTKVRVYNQGEIDDLNASINALRGQVNNKDGELNSACLLYTSQLSCTICKVILIEQKAVLMSIVRLLK